MEFHHKAETSPENEPAVDAEQSVSAVSTEPSESVVGADLSGSIVKAFDKLDAELNNKVNKDTFKALVQLVLGTSVCPDFKLSDPPTVEEVTEINKMVEGTFYTINGGNAVMIFRRPFNDSSNEAGGSTARAGTGWYARRIQTARATWPPQDTLDFLD